MRYDFLWHVAHALGIIPFSFAAYMLGAPDMVWPRRMMARQLQSTYHQPAQGLAFQECHKYASYWATNV
jgi:hypothetical protein